MGNFYAILVDIPELPEIPQCFVAYPFSLKEIGTYSITEVIGQAIDKAKMRPCWIEQVECGKDIYKTINDEIMKSSMLIAVCSPEKEIKSKGTEDVSKPNLNVMYELALADALGLFNGFEQYEFIVNCFEMAIAIYFLNADLTNRLLKQKSYSRK